MIQITEKFKITSNKELTDGQKILYIFLREQANSETSECSLFMWQIAEGINCDIRTVQRRMKKLIQLGLVSRTLVKIRARMNGASIFKILEDCQTSSGQERHPYSDTGVTLIKNIYNNTLIGQDELPLGDSNFEEKTPQEPVKSSTFQEPEVIPGTKKTDQRFDFLSGENDISPKTQDLLELVPDKDRIPADMKDTVRYFLYRTGRNPKSFSEKEIDAVLAVYKKHYPARVQKAISEACERKLQYHESPSKLHFQYIAVMLKDQKSLRPPRRPAAPAPQVAKASWEVTPEERKKILEEYPIFEQIKKSSKFIVLGGKKNDRDNGVSSPEISVR